MESSDVDFKTGKEDWNKYQLEDGTILKLKIILMRIVEETDSGGNKGYSFGWSNVISATPQKEFVGKIQTPVEDMKFEKIHEEPNEYELASGEKLTLIPHITMISRANTLDQRGEPVYTIQMVPALKLKEIRKEQ